MPRMLVTTDGSPESEAVIPVAVDLARSMGAEVHLLRVIPEPEPSGMTQTHTSDPTRLHSGDFYLRATVPVASREAAESRDQAFERAQNEAREQLEEVAKAFDGATVRRHIRIDGNVADAIVRVAKELSPDIIAMSTHGRGVAAAAVQGSVASRVVRSGVAPVLLVRPEALRT